MKKLLLLFILLIVGSGFAREYIAIIDFEAKDVKENEARALTQRLTSEMISLGVYQIVERAEMKRLLDEQKFQYSDCVDMKCAVEIGKMIGAKYMVVGSISKIGQTYSIDSRMIDVKTSEAYISASYSFKGNIDGLLDDGMKSTAMQLSEIAINDKSNKVQVPDISKDIKINMAEEDTSFITNEINKNSEKKDTSIFSMISKYLLPFMSFAAFVLLVGPSFIN